MITPDDSYSGGKVDGEEEHIESPKSLVTFWALSWVVGSQAFITLLKLMN